MLKGSERACACSPLSMLADQLIFNRFVDRAARSRALRAATANKLASLDATGNRCDLAGVRKG